MDTSLPSGLLLRPELLADGWTDVELQRARRAGLLTSVRGGAYVRPEHERLDTPEHRHSLLVEATVPRLRPGAVVSHTSAAVRHGLPGWGVPLDRVHTTRIGESGGRTSGRLRSHVGRLADDEIVERDGLAVTTVARTVVDVALSVPFEPAVAVADTALHRGLCTPDELREALARAAGRPRIAAAARVLRFADGRADRVGESRSRCLLRAAGLPDPELQWEVRGPDGRFLGRVDFAWPDRGVVAEFDGRVKYGVDLPPGRTATDALFAEKRREDAIRSTGLWVVRWTWADLDRFGPIATLLRTRLGLL